MKVDNIIEEAVAEEVAETQVNSAFEQQMREWQEIYTKMHTPFKREFRKVSRNEICPFCGSGVKFKHCECYKTYGEKSEY